MNELVNVFSYGKYMEKFREFQIVGWKILAKSRFFFSRIGRVVGVVLCVLRPSNRLFVKHSTFESTSTHIFDIRLYIRLSLRIYVVKVEVEVR